MAAGLVDGLRWTQLALGSALIDIITQGHRRGCSCRSLSACHIAVNCRPQNWRSIAAARLGQQVRCGKLPLLLPHVACATDRLLQFGCLLRFAQAIPANLQNCQTPIQMSLADLCLAMLPSHNSPKQLAIAQKQRKSFSFSFSFISS